MVATYRDSVETKMIAQAPYVPSAKDSLCPRCREVLRVYYDEAKCAMCGYVDYSYKPPNGRAKHWMESGTTYMVRYCGAFANLKDVVLRVKVEKRPRSPESRGPTHSLDTVPDCPFCGLDMAQLSVSGAGNYRARTESRYGCPQGHRITCEGARDGITGWK